MLTASRGEPDGNLHNNTHACTLGPQSSARMSSSSHCIKLTSPNMCMWSTVDIFNCNCESHWSTALVSCSQTLFLCKVEGHYHFQCKRPLQKGSAILTHSGTHHGDDGGY